MLLTFTSTYLVLISYYISESMTNCYNYIAKYLSSSGSHRSECELEMATSEQLCEHNTNSGVGYIQMTTHLRLSRGSAPEGSDLGEGWTTITAIDYYALLNVKHDVLITYRRQTTRQSSLATSDCALHITQTSTLQSKTK
jgi:hypothetical protein